MTPLMQPALHGGQSLTKTAASQQIEKTIDDVCRWLFDQGMAPEEITNMTLRYLVFKELYTLCGNYPTSLLTSLILV